MIEFACPGCGRKFSVGDHLAGRRATCKTCGGVIQVPGAAPVSLPRAESAETAVAAPSPARKVPMRVRRLQSDAEQMQKTFAAGGLIRVKPLAGDPPDKWRIDYAVRGLERGDGAVPVPRAAHSVEIQLTADYPRAGPLCRMLTPIFHPNIDPSHICVGDHWTAGERLVDLVIRIGEMIAYQAYNIRSPLDAEAAMWADLHADQLPIDPRGLHPKTD